MENRKLFGFDLDGTLLTSVKEKDGMSREIKNLIKRIKEKGHVPAILTGRSFDHSIEVYEYFGFDTIMANNNGAFISNPKDVSFEKQILFLENGLADSIMQDDKVKEFKNDVIIHFPSAIYSEQTPDSFVTNFFERNDINANYKKYSEDIELPNDSFAILIEVKDTHSDKAQYLCDYLKEKYSNELDVSSWKSFHADVTIVEIVNKKARKDFALEKIAKYYNISMKNTIAFGDGGNDLHMLIRANLGVAMLNGGDKIKSIANDTTKYISNEFGVLRYIEDNNLI
ncbi:MAG: HAD-IIB family hydrolase [Mycoplasmataceae bacterium]|nr:HAD-IIB family hydrolase [Mycoplasmataceae bacterium]